MFLFVTFFTEFLFLNFFSWPNVNSWGLRGSNFMDMDATLNFVECFKTYGMAIYGSVAVEQCSHYVYGSLLIALLYLVSGASWLVNILGFVSMLLISGIVSHSVSYLKSSAVFKVILGTILVVSPPFSLLAERGNIDSVIFAVLLLSLTLCYSKPTHNVGYFLLALTCMTKFYTLPIFVLIFITQKRYSSRNQNILFIVTVFVTLFDFVRVESLPTKSPYASFGNTLFGDYLTQVFGDSSDLMALSILLGLAAYVVGTALFFFLFKKFSDWQRGYSRTLGFFIAICFFLVFICCYFAGRNYDYRLVLLVVSVLFLIPSSSRLIKPFLIIGIIVLLFTSYNANAISQALGDAFILIFLSFLSALFIHASKDVKSVLT